MNALMKHSYTRLLVLVLTLGTVALSILMFQVGGSYIVTAFFLHPANAAYGLSILLSWVLAIYYIIKLVWGEKYLNFDPKSTKWRLIAFTLFVVASYCTILIALEVNKLLQFDFDEEITFALQVHYWMIIYMIGIAGVTGFFIANLSKK